MKMIGLYILSLVAINISTISAAHGADPEACAKEVPALVLKRIDLQPLISNILSDTSTDSAAKLSKLSSLIGLNISATHRYYPKESTQTKRSKVVGKIISIRAEDSLEGLFKMTVATNDGEKEFDFSNSVSPSFVVIETDSTEAGSESRQNLLRDAANLSVGYSHPDILAVGLDTPPKTAEYKRGIQQRRAIPFYGKHSPYYEFSNFYPAEIWVDGQKWPTSEHYFQAQKFADPVYREAIRNAESPTLAAAMGRDRTKTLRPDWDTVVDGVIVKEAVMFRAIEAKFRLHSPLALTLILTGESELIEHTENDKYWGDAEDGSGKNVLGKQLVVLRNILINKPLNHYDAPTRIALISKLLLGRIKTSVEDEAERMRSSDEELKSILSSILPGDQSPQFLPLELMPSFWALVQSVDDFAEFRSDFSVRKLQNLLNDLIYPRVGYAQTDEERAERDEFLKVIRRNARHINHFMLQKMNSLYPFDQLKPGWRGKGI